MHLTFVSLELECLAWRAMESLSWVSGVSRDFVHGASSLVFVHQVLLHLRELCVLILDISSSCSRSPWRGRVGPVLLDGFCQSGFRLLAHVVGGVILGRPAGSGCPAFRRLRSTSRRSPGGRPRPRSAGSSAAAPGNLHGRGGGGEPGRHCNGPSPLPHHATPGVLRDLPASPERPGNGSPYACTLLCGEGVWLLRQLMR